MENYLQAKNLIQEAKNIYLIPAENSLEAIPCAMALFYTLKELGKNVNMVIEDFPEKFKFLIPSVDFISYPRNFVISVPGAVANVSQIYYEKSDENLKIHLTLDQGNLKKDNIAFYYTDAKPDLIITLGVKNFRQELENKLNQFAFLMESDILNVDNASTTLSTNGVQNNKNFGKINLVEEKSISEIILDIIKLIKPFDSAQGEIVISKDQAICLLAGLINYSDNFTNKNTNSGVLETAGFLLKQGADREKIIEEFYKIKSGSQKEIITTIIAKLNEQNLEISKENILKFLEN